MTDNTKRAHVSHNSGAVEWYTPSIFVEAARMVMGSIDTDPASCEMANRTVQARKFFDREADGLKQTWEGNVFLNPPYGNVTISLFAEALTTKYRSDKINQAIVLTNNATETKWFSALQQCASAVCFPRKRIRFLDKDGKPSKAPLQGQALLYFGHRTDRFLGEFAKFGSVWKKAVDTAGGQE